MAVSTSRLPGGIGEFEFAEPFQAACVQGMSVEIQPLFVHVSGTARWLISDEGPHKTGICRRTGKAIVTVGPDIRRPGRLVGIFCQRHPVGNGVHPAVRQIGPIPTGGGMIFMQHHLLHFGSAPAPDDLSRGWQQITGANAAPDWMMSFIHALRTHAAPGSDGSHCDPAAIQLPLAFSAARS